MIVTVGSQAELTTLAETVAKRLKPADVLALVGPLAAGKTTFTQRIVQAMGYSGVVTSPTFVIEHRYPVNYGEIQTVIHLDLYRLTVDDIAALDWPEYVGIDDQVTLIEWPEKAVGYLPSHVKTVTIEIIDDHRRRFHLPDNLVA